MKSYRKELTFNVPTRRAFLNITPDVEAYLAESGIKEGFGGKMGPHLYGLLPKATL